MVTETFGADPRNKFLTRSEVMLRYGWGRTKGYEKLRERLDGFPPAIDGRYRLDTLLAWEERRLEALGWALDEDKSSSERPKSASALREVPTLPAKRLGGRPRKGRD